MSRPPGTLHSSSSRSESPHFAMNSFVRLPTHSRYPRGVAVHVARPLAPFSSTASTIRFPVVRPDRCARSQNLFAQYLSFCCFRQLGKQANNLQREFLRALPEIFFFWLYPS